MSVTSRVASGGEGRNNAHTEGWEAKVRNNVWSTGAITGLLGCLGEEGGRRQGVKETSDHVMVARHKKVSQVVPEVS